MTAEWAVYDYTPLMSYSDISCAALHSLSLDYTHETLSHTDLSRLHFFIAVQIHYDQINSRHGVCLRGTWSLFIVTTNRAIEKHLASSADCRAVLHLDGHE
jgi:hypothetical protein